MIIGKTDIISRIRRGDRDAFNELCRERYASLLSYAHLFLRGSYAEDVVQDVLFGLWENRRNLDPDRNIQSYLLRSVYNRCVNYAVSNKRLNASLDYYQARIDSLMSEYYSPDRNPIILGLYNADLRRTLEKAIDSLTPRCREVFTLRYVEQMTEKEISERLNLSLSTVENHMYSALKQLRLVLEKN